MDTNNKDNEPSYESKPTEGVEKVFFFLMYFDESRQKGMILLERQSPYGIKSVFGQILKAYFKDYFPDYILKPSTFLDREVTAEIINQGLAKSIVLKTNKISCDNSDKLNISREESNDYIFELKIKKKRGHFGSSTKQVLKKLFDEKEKNYLLSDSLKSAGFGESTDITVNFEYDNRPKKLTLGHQSCHREVFMMF